MATSRAASAKAGAAARSENGRRSFVSDVAGKGKIRLDLPGKMPFVVMRYLSEDDPVKALTAIVGDEQMDEVWDAGLDIDQGKALIEEIIGEYDMTSGKSSASAKS